MNLSENSKWVKSYNFLLSIANNFWGRDSEEKRLTHYSSRYSQVDICKFIRRFILWTPLYTIFYALYYIAIFLFLYKINSETYGLGITLYAGVYLASALVFGFLALSFIFICFDKLKERNEKDKVEKEPTVVGEWYNSIKTKTCSLIKIGK